MIQISKADPGSPDLFVAAATVIPVLFLGIALEGGLWRWINSRIAGDSQASSMTQAFISLLHMLAVLIVIVGVVGEITALYALWQSDFSAVAGYITFLSTSILVVILGIQLTTLIPGLYWINLNTLKLDLWDDESLRWSGVSVRWTHGLAPYRGGKLFVTNRRLVWLTPREIGLLAAPPVEIRAEQLSQIDSDVEQIRPRLIRLMLGQSSFTPGRNRIIVFTKAGESFSFYLDNKAFKEAEPYLNELLLSATTQ